MKNTVKPATFPSEASLAEQLRFLNLEQTKAKTSLGKTLIYQLISDGEFPSPIPLTKSGSRVAWLESEVNDYIRVCIASRSQRGAK